MSDWSVVGYGADPIPDDPGVVAAQVEHIRAVAADLAAQLASLPSDGQVDSIRWESAGNHAPDEFKTVVKKLPRDLKLLHARYVKVGDAMGAFQQTLTQVKAQAQQNLQLATAAQNDIQAAQNGVRQMNDYNQQAQQAAARANAAAKPGTPPATVTPWTGPDWPSLLSDAERRLSDAQAQVHDAVRRFHSASSTAAGAVHAASQDGLKNDDSFWGTIAHAAESVLHAALAPAHWLATHIPLKAISSLLNKISGVLAIAALAVSIIPGVGDIVGAALATAVLYLSVASFVCDAIAAENDLYEGNLDLKSFAFTMGADALAVVLSKFGVGAAGDDLAKYGADEAAKEASLAAGREWKVAASQVSDSERAAAAQEARVVSANSGNPIKQVALRVVGYTGRQERRLADLRNAAADAEDFEHEAWTAWQARAEAASQAHAEFRQAQALARGVSAAGVVFSGQVVSSQEGGSWSPTTWASSTSEQTQDVFGHWADSDVRAENTGAQLRAHTITLPAP